MAKLVSKIVEIWHDRKRILGMPISFTRYALSEDRLFLKRGFLNVRHDEIVLYRVRDLRVSVSLWQRIFGVGTIVNIIGCGVCIDAIPPAWPRNLARTASMPSRRSSALPAL